MNHQTSLPQMPLLKRFLVFLWTWTLIVTRVSALSGVSRIIPNVNVSNSGYRGKGNYNHSLGDPHFRPFGRDPTPLQFVPNLVSSSRSSDTQRTSNRPFWLQCPIRPPETISVGSLPVVGERRQEMTVTMMHPLKRDMKRMEREKTTMVIKKMRGSG